MLLRDSNRQHTTTILNGNSLTLLVFMYLEGWEGMEPLLFGEKRGMLLGVPVVVEIIE